jgi:hypothetical protein
LASSPEGDIVSSSSTMQPADDFQLDALTLAKQALSASRQAAAMADELKLIKVVDNDDDSLPLRLVLSLWLTLASLIWLFIGL